MDIRYKARIKTKNNRLYTIPYIIYEVNSKKAMEKFGKYLLNYIEMIKYYLNKKSLRRMCWFERKKEKRDV